MNCCRITDLHSKQVINTKTGCRLGFVSDVEVNTTDGRLMALIIWGKTRFPGKHEDDIRILWKDIQVIGDDTILVCNSECIPFGKGSGKQGIFDNIFH